MWTLSSSQAIYVLPHWYRHAPSTSSKYNLPTFWQSHNWGKDRTVSLSLLNELQALLHLRHKIQTFARSFHCKPFETNMLSRQKNLATLKDLDTSLSSCYRLYSQGILDTEIGTALAYQTRIIDNLQKQPTPRTLHTYVLPALTSKTRETAFPFPNRSVWMNIKSSNLGWDLIPT
jgi:hypothetical protein